MNGFDRDDAGAGGQQYDRAGNGGGFHLCPSHKFQCSFYQGQG
jgi:hypothetical protein